MVAIGCIENKLSAFTDGDSRAVVHHGRRHHSDSRVAVIVVVPGEEDLAECPAVLDAAEPIGKLGAVFRGAELAFRVRIIVGRVGSAVGLGHTEISQKESDWFGSHGRSAVGMQTELAWLDVLLFVGFFDKLFGQFGTLAGSQHPTDDVTAEDIEDNVEIKVGPLGGREAKLSSGMRVKLKQAAEALAAANGFAVAL